MKKKTTALLLAAAMVAAMLTGCGKKEEPAPEIGGSTSIPASAVELNVTTTFAGNDGNAQNYKDAIAAFEAETGIKVNDSSATSDETFKARVETDFQAGSEPDVLFFFTGADANSFIAEGKVKSIEEIRAEYPEYAGNMMDSKLPASLVDGKQYAVPVNGFWEGMFVNTKILQAAGVEVPGVDYTWEQFMADCQTIKDAGFTPIAAALGNVPHYWWEFSIFNHNDPADHLTVPAAIDEGNGANWVSGMKDIKELYEKGFFPENTLSATDGETFELFMADKAAFLIDGSWKVGGIVGACQSDPEDPSTLDAEKLDNYTVTYVPGKGGIRKTTDLIGGLSMGYYVTTKAWENEAVCDAAVKFVEYMTSDEIIPVFAQHTATALKTAPTVDPAKFNSLQVKAIDMMANVTSLTGAVQDVFNGECRVSTFENGMPLIVTGQVTAEEAVAEGLAAYAEMNG